VRRPGPVPEEYWGCTRACWNLERHTEEDGCERYTPPCKHPVESIGYDSEGEGREVCCQDCQVPLSVQKLAEEASPGLWVGGCHCSYVCTGRCPAPTPSAWNLDPAKVLRILELESYL
jgi:hypothetical protein